MKKLVLSIALLGLVLGFQSCEGCSEKVKEASEEAAEATGDAAESLEEAGKDLKEAGENAMDKAKEGRR